jgi:hypothetical protein
MKLTIETADNGYVLSYPGDDPDLSSFKEIQYIAVEDTDFNKDVISDARLTQKLLWEIMEHFQLFGSKHDEERCNVILRNKEGKEIE